MNDPGTNPQRIQLFENRQLEKLTLISPRGFSLVWAVTLPLIAWAGWATASMRHGAALFALGLLVWSLFEYALHRFLFHWDSDAKAVKWLVFAVHGNHHIAPNDPLRNLMPPLVSLPISAAVWAVCVALLGMAGTWAFLGFIVGYVGYDLIHYACHQWPMRGRIGLALKRHHMRHHHIDEHGNYAITAIFWDRVFGSNITQIRSAR
jgi:sterol desaturase/sphingolipid hydroxylase (fatty acid hydroxylase superfamily)